MLSPLYLHELHEVKYLSYSWDLRLTMPHENLTSIIAYHFQDYASIQSGGSRVCFIHFCLYTSHHACTPHWYNLAAKLTRSVSEFLTSFSSSSFTLRLILHWINQFNVVHSPSRACRSDLLKSLNLLLEFCSWLSELFQNCLKSLFRQFALKCVRLST